MAHAADAFPRQQARTRRFSLGAPRNFTISPDGERVVFLRAPAGDDPMTAMWVYETATASEREVASAAALLGEGDDDLPPEERARRERSRELAGGIVGYACDEAVRHAAFPLGQRLWWVPLDRPGAPGPAGRGGGPGGVAAGGGAGDGAPVELPSLPGVVDPRPSPDGQLVAFLSGPCLCAVRSYGRNDPFVVAEGQGDVTWGAAEFVAAEEMGRSRGYWWSPDSRSLLVARVDNGPVGAWWTFDPSVPWGAPQSHPFPPAGGADALVELWHLEATPGGGRHLQVQWDARRYPYLVAVHWSRLGPPLVLVEQRDHTDCAVLAVDIGTGATSRVAGATDDAWVDWPPGVPAWLDDGRLLWAAASSGTWRLQVGDELVTPPGLQVREVTSTRGQVVFTASRQPEVVEAWSWSAAKGLRQLTDIGGVTTAAAEGAVRTVVSRSLGWPGARAEIQVEGSSPQVILNKSERPVVEPEVRFFRLGTRQLSVGVVLPRGHGGGKLPVVMAPYGGPGHQMVMAAMPLWLEAQWLADQGFAVVVADGRGTPGRGPDFERQVYRDLAHPALEDQVEALHEAAAEVPELDLDRVGIKGWSFGGYLAALAVLARPDVFHAAVAGAPVTDWRFYDSYYTERFLGHPEREPEAYRRCSLLPLAAQLARPLMIIHGLADDNVFVVHTLRLSSALLAAGRPHSVVPLPGITHVAAREDVAENLLLAQVDFLRRALAQPATQL